MNKLRKFLIAFAILGIVIIIFYMVNSDDLSWSKNRANYVGIFSQICIIIAMIGSIRLDNKTK